MEKLVVDPNLCTGCRSCEVICTYHHTGAFGRKASSIRVKRDEEKGVFDIAIAKNGEYACDLCGGDPLCIKYCAVGAITMKKN